MGSEQSVSHEFKGKENFVAEEAYYDVVIIGAGINGAGLFRDLCEQGVSCLLVEKNDYGAGTSAAPSRLIHGGLKYIETAELGLVAQSTLERNLLLRNAPHYVKPLSTFIPVFSWTKGLFAAIRTLFGSTTAPRSRGALLIKIGLIIYDFYGARKRAMPKHRFLLRRRALALLPILNKNIVALGNYYDAKISQPERLVWELISDGLRANEQSKAVNGSELTQVEHDVLSFRQDNGQVITVKTTIVINAAGPWIDKVNQSLGVVSKMIGGTKGSHILLDHSPLISALNGAMVYFEADDGRICLVFEYLGRVLVGSTDSKADDPDNVKCEDEEIDYFLQSLSSLMPSLSFARDQIVYSYSGIRPLPASDSIIPGLISRDHSAPVFEATQARPFAIISLIGGKWTTFRGFSEEVADNVLKRLHRQRRISTQDLPIGGGRDFPLSVEDRALWVKRVSDRSGLKVNRIEQLLERYGSYAENVAMHQGGWKDEQRLPDSTDFSLAEIEWIVEHEHVNHLADIVMRRTTLAVTGSVTIQDIKVITETVASLLGWDEEQKRQEIDTLTKQLIHRNSRSI
jgi:glycerol-3-phosphate dehydrogenase